MSMKEKVNVSGVPETMEIRSCFLRENVLVVIEGFAMYL